VAFPQTGAAASLEEVGNSVVAQALDDQTDVLGSLAGAYEDRVVRFHDDQVLHADQRDSAAAGKDKVAPTVGGKHLATPEGNVAVSVA
jgi:hypothetical protein